MTPRRTKDWWERTVARWRRSGQTAREFATREGVRPGTLLWWSSRLGRGTRAGHGAQEITAIEIAVPLRGERAPAGSIEVVAGDTVVRCEVGTDVEYVATLVRRLRES
jgi:hypothetical protein